MNSIRSCLFVTIFVDKVPVKMFVDTGASVSIISEKNHQATKFRHFFDIEGECRSHYIIWKLLKSDWTITIELLDWEILSFSKCLGG